MSATEWRARLTSQALGLTVYGVTPQVLSGSLALEQDWQIEEIESAGVDGVRHRARHQRPVELLLRLDEALSSGVDFATRETQYLAMKRHPITLDLVCGSTIYRWRNTIVMGVTIIDRAGPLVGFGELAGSTRTLFADWTLRRVEAAE